MHSWMVCGTRRGVVLVRHRELVIMGAGLSWPDVTLAPAARSWLNHAARPSRPGPLARTGPWPWSWLDRGSPVLGGLAGRIRLRQRRRMRFMTASSWLGSRGAGCGHGLGGAFPFLRGSGETVNVAVWVAWWPSAVNDPADAVACPGGTASTGQLALRMT